MQGLSCSPGLRPRPYAAAPVADYCSAAYILPQGRRGAGPAGASVAILLAGRSRGRTLAIGPRAAALAGGSRLSLPAGRAAGNLGAGRLTVLERASRECCCGGLTIINVNARDFNASGLAALAPLFSKPQKQSEPPAACDANRLEFSCRAIPTAQS
jgi:hypothetical protein